MTLDPYTIQVRITDEEALGRLTAPALTAVALRHGFTEQFRSKRMVAYFQRDPGGFSRQVIVPCGVGGSLTSVYAVSISHAIEQISRVADCSELEIYRQIYEYNEE